LTNYPDRQGRWHVVALVDLALRRLKADMEELGAPNPFPDLSGSRFRLLSMIPPGGARSTELAEMAGVSKQALGQLVQQLVTLGYLELVEDPADRRARLVQRTTKGDDAAGHADDLIARLERSWREELGAERFDALADALNDLVAKIAPPIIPGGMARQ
jgi:DNA-binding MarR family transcriptional regulator